MSQAQTLLLDEPFTGMDEATKARAKQLIEQKSSEKYVVIATHIV
jgi:ABC-type Mn2+/Zn2+ transport system ATPase subunit